MRLRLWLSLLIIVFTSFATNASGAAPTDVLVDMVPINPTPFGNVSITLRSYLDNLDSVLISWSENGKIVASGTGKKSFSTTAPGAGKESTVIVKLSLPSGLVEKKIIIRPSATVLLWQATDSYVPPFYRGKALPTPESEVKVVAIPEIRTATGLVDYKNMTYRWKKDYTNNVDGSGYGKSFFLYVSDYLDDTNNISVGASTVDQRYSSDASINIGTSQPKILFYKNDSTLGTLWNKALADNHKIEGSEIVEAAPYFISPKNIRTPTLIWNWYINDNLVDNLDAFKKHLMPLQAEEGVHGTSKLRLEIANQDKIFQSSNKEIIIEF